MQSQNLNYNYKLLRLKVPMCCSEVENKYLKKARKRGSQNGLYVVLKRTEAILYYVVYHYLSHVQMFNFALSTLHDKLSIRI